MVVVGYTYLDEGEFIGGDATRHLTELLPGPDDPELVAAFQAEVASRPAVEPPPHVAHAAQGFATGGDRTSLRLSDAHVELIRATAAANPRTVVAIMAGSAVVISEWDQLVPAILQPFYAGMEGGHALADVLLGNVGPRGRLPFSVPRSEADLPPFDRDATSSPTTAGTAGGTSSVTAPTRPIRSASASTTRPSRSRRQLPR